MPAHLFALVVGQALAQRRSNRVELDREGRQRRLGRGVWHLGQQHQARGALEQHSRCDTKGHNGPSGSSLGLGRALRPTSCAISRSVLPCSINAASVTRSSACICRNLLVIFTPYRGGKVLQFRLETAGGLSSILDQYTHLCFGYVIGCSQCI